MTREKYIERVQKLRDLYDKENMMYELGVNTADFTAGVCSEYMNMLAEMTNDIPNDVYGSELDYFCFERDFGEQSYYADAAKQFYIKNAGDLYDYLVSRKSN